MAFNAGELILCVPAREVRKLGITEPFHRRPRDAILAKLIGLGTFQMRGAVEDDEAWRQLIPYVVSRCDGRILLLERLTTQGEKRLHNLLSIGAGGHTNPTDSVNGGRNIIENALWRELNEELEFGEKPEVKLMGLINFHADPVARVHLGFTYLADFVSPPGIREKDKMTGKFVLPEELKSYYSRMEGWSKVLVDHLEM
jgi:predicted NUDIX family phosphoesterase